jgi:Tannase and feruloyl esterase
MSVCQPTGTVASFSRTSVTGGSIIPAGGLTNAERSFGLINGYAVASQNGGHFDTDLALPTCDSGYGNPNEFLLDPLGTIAFAYQSWEVTTLIAKYLINQFYGVGPHHSYWAGCSNGGTHGMVMSQFRHSSTESSRVIRNTIAKRTTSA